MVRYCHAPCYALSTDSRGSFISSNNEKYFNKTISFKKGNVIEMVLNVTKNEKNAVIKYYHNDKEMEGIGCDNVLFDSETKYCLAVHISDGAQLRLNHFQTLHH